MLASIRHSVRGATTSHAYAKGVPVADLLHAVAWTNKRPSENTILGNVILKARQ